MFRGLNKTRCPGLLSLKHTLSSAFSLHRWKHWGGGVSLFPRLPSTWLLALCLHPKLIIFLSPPVYSLSLAAPPDRHHSSDPHEKHHTGLFHPPSRTSSSGTIALPVPALTVQTTVTPGPCLLWRFTSGQWLPDLFECQHNGVTLVVGEGYLSIFPTEMCHCSRTSWKKWHRGRGFITHQWQCQNGTQIGWNQCWQCSNNFQKWCWNLYN